MPVPEIFFAALQSAGIPEVPGEFSVVPRHQVIPNAVLGEIAKFARVFDQVTAREAWQAAARHEAPAIAQLRRLKFASSVRGISTFRLKVAVSLSSSTTMGRGSSLPQSSTTCTTGLQV